MILRSSHSAIRPSRGFTAMEMILVILIISITAVLSLDLISSFEASQRAERASRECLAFFRYARHYAITTGKKTRVTIDNTAHTFGVYWNSNGDGTTYDSTPVTNSLMGTGSMLIDLDTQKELIGTTMTVSPNANPQNFVYSVLGTCTPTSGSITFTYGSKSKTLTIPTVGDPTIN